MIIQNNKALRLALYEIGAQFDKRHWANRLMLAVLEVAVMDATRKHPNSHTASAIDYLKGEIVCAEACGVDSDYIRRVLKKYSLL